MHNYISLKKRKNSTCEWKYWKEFALRCVHYGRSWLFCSVGQKIVRSFLVFSSYKRGSFLSSWMNLKMKTIHKLFLCCAHEEKRISFKILTIRHTHKLGQVMQNLLYITCHKSIVPGMSSCRIITINCISRSENLLIGQNVIARKLERKIRPIYVSLTQFIATLSLKGFAAIETTRWITIGEYSFANMIDQIFVKEKMKISNTNIKINEYRI